MFSSKPVVLLVLRRGALVAYDTKGGREQLNFTTNLVRNLEVADTQGFIDKLMEFAAAQGLRRRLVLLALDDSTVFQKTFNGLGAESDPVKLQQDYSDMLPFDAPNKRLLVLQPKNSMILIGTNVQLYACVITALQGIGAKVAAVVPLAIYGKLGSDIHPKQVSQILHNQRLAEKTNFLDLEVRK